MRGFSNAFVVDMVQAFTLQGIAHAYHPGQEGAKQFNDLAYE